MPSNSELHQTITILSLAKERGAEGSRWDVQPCTASHPGSGIPDETLFPPGHRASVRTPPLLPHSLLHPLCVSAVQLPQGVRRGKHPGGRDAAPALPGHRGGGGSYAGMQMEKLGAGGGADVERPLILPGHRICLRTCGGESSRGSFMTLWEDDTWSAMGWQRN